MVDKYIELAQNVLKCQFNDINLLIMAFTHRSYINEHKKSAKGHNERLEFLGDAVLELVVTNYLYLNHDDAEGVLTNWRSALVRTESIAQGSIRAGFEPYLRLSRGEKKGSERAREQILANTYEAVIGAIYLDQGIEIASKFIHETLLITLPDIIHNNLWLDAKSRLQELAQSKYGSAPSYKVISEDGPDHEKIFNIGVLIDDRMISSGQGHSKQIAQQAAAQDALIYIQNQP